MDSLIRTSEADFRGRELEYVSRAISSGWITQGKLVREFEERFAELCGRRYAVACASGTAALHLAMRALGVGRHDSVIVPALTYVATANAAYYCGADVFFADVDKGDWCIDYASVGAEVNRTGSHTSLVVPVHLFDALADVDRASLSWTHRVIEDVAHAPGIGNPGSEMACYSFYASKIIATGEGGAVVTDDITRASALRLYRGQGATTPGQYHHDVVGFNYRMTDIQAAIGLAQLERLSEFVARRREIANRYRANLAGSTLTLQAGTPAMAWIVGVLLPEDCDADRRESVRAEMLDEGVETRPFFEPLNTLPMYERSGSSCPIAEEISARGICLPTHTLLSDSEVDRVCETLLRAVREVR